ADKVKTSLLSSGPIGIDKKQYSAMFGRYSREMIEKLLWDIEDGQMLGAASSLNFMYDDALMIYERALSLVKNEDGTLNHKLISKRRKQRSNHILIAPTPLHYHEELTLVHQCFEYLVTLYKSKAYMDVIKHLLKLFYYNNNISTSEIHYTFKQNKYFYNYLD